MKSETPSTVPGGHNKPMRARAQSDYEPDPSDEDFHGKHFSPEEKCYLAHHVNHSHDFPELCQMFNLKFDADCTIESITCFFWRCDGDEFFDLTEQGQEYKWCIPHPMFAVAPPSMVLGTPECRTELRAFLAFQVSKNVEFAELKESFSAAFPEESRTSGQIRTQLAQIHKKQGLVRQLQLFAESYPWHPLYAAATSASPTSTKASKADAKAAAKARFNQDKQRINEYQSNQAAIAIQRESIRSEGEKFITEYTNMVGQLRFRPRPNANYIPFPELTAAQSGLNFLLETDDTASTAVVSPNSTQAATGLLAQTAAISESIPAEAVPILGAKSSQPTNNAVNAITNLNSAPKSDDESLKDGLDAILGPSDPTRTTFSGPHYRPGHAAGRARSASPAKEDIKGDRKVEGGRREIL